MTHLWLAVLCLILMAAFIVAEYREMWVVGVFLKGAASLCFVILGIVGLGGAADARFAGFVVAGLAVGAAADVLINLRYVYKKRKALFFTCGTIVFLIGHMLYTRAIWPRAAVPWLFVIIGVAATYVIMRWISLQIKPRQRQSARAITVIYLGALTILSFLALSALFARFGAQPFAFAAGVLLFLASDIIHIINSFGRSPQFEHRALYLVLYYIGQILIALSLQLA